ncbi:uncharacterized protein LOC112145519, partial [Oryzias melastigma]|uniref:uncharacterized protein LOC112145519 n=1 Tax=Oryzias melastigma TaxID=30732 RepID=UPI000CF7F59E
MTSAVLRVILGPDSSQRVTFPNGLPSTVPILELEIKTQCNLTVPFRLQFMDRDFDNEFVNLTSMKEIEDKSTLKVTLVEEAVDSIAHGTLYQPGRCYSNNFGNSSICDDHPIIASSSSSFSRSSWPEVFNVPNFSLDAEFKIQEGQNNYLKNGTLLNVDPKLKRDIISSLVQEIVKYKLYASNRDVSEAAEALVQKYPCLREKGSTSGCEGWKVSLKYKLSNYRRELRKAGCPEVSINAFERKHKSSPALGVKKPKRGEVSYLPTYPPGHNEDSLEKMRMELLSDILIRDNRKAVKEKMEKTFPLRRLEVVQDAPMIKELLERWPALFTPEEINAEFKRLTNTSLQSQFLSQLDFLTPNLLRLFQKSSSRHRNKLKLLAASISDDTDAARESMIRGLMLCLNEDFDALVRDQNDMTEDTIEATTVGIFVAREDQTMDYSDVGIRLEGQIVIRDLDN